VQLEDDAGKFFYESIATYSNDQNLAKYDFSSCSVLRSWKFDQALKTIIVSPDHNYLVLGFGGAYPKVKVRVHRYGDCKELSSVPTKRPMIWNGNYLGSPNLATFCFTISVWPFSAA
jgi:hypothetical protein